MEHVLQLIGGASLAPSALGAAAGYEGVNLMQGTG